MTRFDRASGVARLRSHAWRRGMGGSQGYLALAVGMTAARVLRRVANPKPEVLYRHKLEPGERWEIVARAPEPEGRRKRDR